VNGEAPPYPLGEQEGFFLDILEGHITLNPDLSCEFGHTLRLASLEDSTVKTNVEKEACTWTITPAAVHLRFPTGYISGVFSRDALYFSYSFTFPASFVYERGNPPR
jgi:hypothetical protein